MDREEILKKAQKEGKDERVLQVRDKSLYWSLIGMLFFAAMFAGFRQYHGESILDPTATCCAALCAGHAYRYVQTKDRSAFIIALITFAVMIVETVRFFTGY